MKKLIKIIKLSKEEASRVRGGANQQVQQCYQLCCCASCNDKDNTVNNWRPFYQGDPNG